MCSVTCRPAADADVPALAALGERTFRDTFAGENTPENLDAYIAATYGAAHQRAELRDPAFACIVAEDGGALIAFALLHDDAPAPGCVPREARCQLSRFYVDRHWHGRGVAQALMAATCRAARGRGATAIWLTVWERNPRAIAFYLRQGFRDVGGTLFMLGADPQHDRVMVRALDQG